MKVNALVVVAFLSLVCAPVSQGKNATLTLLKDAASKGAVCLDGSPPGYYYRAGQGNGTNKWIVHLEGGAWCYLEADCYARSKSDLGSSKNWPPSVALAGFLSDNVSVNPDFFNWNIVFAKYCDGASFAGSVANPIYYNNTPIYFRGCEILNAILDDLLEIRGMKDSSDLILTGCSVNLPLNDLAGGLATYIHADHVRAYIPQSVNFVGLADAGYFLDIPAVIGIHLYRLSMQSVFIMQNVSGGLNQDCLKAYSDDDAWKCFFAPYSFEYIKSPMFVLNSDYDTAQLAGILKLGCLPPNCSEIQMEFFNHFRVDFLAQLQPATKSVSTGMFIDSCLIHCQTLTDEPWATYMVNRQTMREAFAHWYLDHTQGVEVKEIDCAYPCNPTCKNPTQTDVLSSNLKEHNL